MSISRLFPLLRKALTIIFILISLANNARAVNYTYDFNNTRGFYSPPTSVMAPQGVPAPNPLPLGSGDTVVIDSLNSLANTISIPIPIYSSSTSGTPQGTITVSGGGFANTIIFDSFIGYSTYTSPTTNTPAPLDSMTLTTGTGSAMNGFMTDVIQLNDPVNVSNMYITTGSNSYIGTVGVTFNNPLTVSNNFTIHTGDFNNGGSNNLAFNSSFLAGNSLVITTGNSNVAGGDVVFTDTVSVNNALTVNTGNGNTAGGFVSFGNVSVNDNLTVNTGNGNAEGGYVQFGPTTVNNGDISITTGNNNTAGNVVFDNSVTVNNGDISITTGDTNDVGGGFVEFDDSVTVHSGNITIITGNSNNVRGGRVSFSSNVEVSNDFFITTGNSNDVRGGQVIFGDIVSVNNNLSITTGNSNPGGGRVGFNNSVTATQNFSLTTGNNNTLVGGYVITNGLVSPTNLSLTTGTGNDNISSFILIEAGMTVQNLSLNLGGSTGNGANNYGGALYLFGYNINNNNIPVTNNASNISLLSSNDPATPSLLQLTGVNGPQTIDLNAFTLIASALNSNIINALSNATGAQLAPPSLASSLTFAGSNVVLNTNFNGTNKIGNIVMSGASDGTGGGPQPSGTPSTLDLSNANSLAINLSLNGSYVADGTILPLFTQQNGGSVVQLPTRLIPEITLINANQLYTSTATLISNTDGSGYSIQVGTNLNSAPGNMNNNTGNIYNTITTPANADGTMTQAQIDAINNVGAANNIVQALSALEVTTIAEEVNSSTAAASVQNITRRAAEVGPAALFTEEESMGVAAGNMPEKKRDGVWVSGFGMNAMQKSYDDVIGYKLSGAGGSIGFDREVSDGNVIVGLAWTYIKSILKHKDDLNGNKGTTDSNIISLYGITKLGNDWLMQGSIAGGFSNTKSQSVRMAGNTATIAQAKYKSSYYGGNVLLLKSYPLTNKYRTNSLAIEPNLGLNYGFFHDNSYKEKYGATNWNVSARNSYNLEALVGGKLKGTRLLENSRCKLEPYITSSAHIMLANKKGDIKVALDNSVGTNLVQGKASPAWYSGGAGVEITQNDALTIDLSWEAQLDKKYLANQVTCKLRWDF